MYVVHTFNEDDAYLATRYIGTFFLLSGNNKGLHFDFSFLKSIKKVSECCLQFVTHKDFGK